MLDDRHFFRPDEFSKELRISISQVYRMIHTGEIISVRIRKQLRIPKQEYCRFCRGTGKCHPCTQADLG